MKKRVVALFLLSAALAATVSAQTWRFVATGDSRGGGAGLNEVNTNILRDIAIAIVGENPDLVLFSGDLIQGYPATESAFRYWTNAMAPVYQAGISVYPVRGNHDVGTGWVEVFGPDVPDNGPAGELDMTFWVTHKNGLFIGLDQYVRRSRVNQPWLDGVLASNTALHVFPFGHEPAFMVQHQDCLDDYPAQRDAFWRSLERAGGKAYFCGHDHFLDIARLDDGDGNSTNDLYQYVVGTAGAPLYAIPATYNGNNGSWTPRKVLDARDYGYVVGEVDGAQVTLTWKRRTAPGTFAAEHALVYNVLDQYVARAPSPADASILVRPEATLGWTSSIAAISHLVYLGTNLNEVASATTNAPSHAGAVTNMFFDPPGELTHGATYFWRIDEILASGFVATGGVWSFTTTPLTPLIANDGGAEHIMDRSATLTGNLLTTGGAPTTVYAFWGANDGGQVKEAWEHTNELHTLPEGPFQTQVDGLDLDTLYAYRCYATNVYGDAWAPASSSFTTLPGMDAWPYKMKMTLNGYDKPEVLVDFPLLVILRASAGMDYTQFVSPTGDDLRFTGSDGVKVLNHEIERWNTNGDSYVWVQVPQLASNTFLWAHWGNPAATNPAPSATNGATWSADFAGVWHLDETSGGHADATAYGNDGIPRNGVVQDEAGVIDGADGFDGVNDFIGIADAPSLRISDAITVSAWIRARAWKGEHVIVRKDGDYRFYMRDLGVGGPYAMTLKLKGLSVEEAGYGIEHYNTGRWYYVVGTYDRNQPGSNLLLYTDGALVASTASSGRIAMTADDVIIGSKQGTSYFFDGLIDEVRISSVSRSSNWVWACWMNQKPGSDMVASGPVVEVDSDADGLPDWWELRYFGNLTASSGSDTDDRDGDFFPDRHEYAAGTDPTDPLSFLGLSGIRPGLGAACVLEWQSVSGRIYAIDFVSNLFDSWTAIVSNIPAFGPVNAHTVTPDAVWSEFYRIRLDEP